MTVSVAGVQQKQELEQLKEAWAAKLEGRREKILRQQQMELEAFRLRVQQGRPARSPAAAL